MATSILYAGCTSLCVCTRGEPHQGKKGCGITRHGSQGGAVPLSDRKPWLRDSSGEVHLPAYAALKAHPGAGAKMLDTLLAGVSTRNYQGVIREMADTAGVSKSAVSREFVQQSEKALEDLLARRFDDLVIVAIDIDGIILGSGQSKHHVLTALGVDQDGNKLVLGLRDGASENGAVVTLRPTANGTLIGAGSGFGGQVNPTFGAYSR